MAGLEDIQCDVIAQMYQQDLSTLLKLANQLSITDVADQTKGKVLRLLRDHVEQMTDKADGELMLRGLLQQLSVTSPPQASVKTQMETMNLPTNPNTQPMYRKDLRISGQIGDSNQKDRLSFSSLNHQVESGVSKGYSEGEVVEAVLKAINPGLRLRSYLENYSGLTLTTLRTVLKSHYQEKDATDLYQELAQLTQDRSETPQAFVMRALDLRQRITRASGETTGLRYDDALVKNMFLHAVKTGLTNDNIRIDLKSGLDVDISDEALLGRLNTAVALETKRQQKTSRRPAHVSAVGNAQEDKSEIKRETPKQDGMMHAMAAQLAELTACVAALQVKAVDHNSSPDQRPRYAPRPRGCPSCQTADYGDTCRHCYKCGGENHIARGCRGVPRSTQNQGNGSRAPQGDRALSSNRTSPYPVSH